MKNQTPQWKPVALDSSFFLGDTGGLLGIEECTDYELPNVAEAPTAPKKARNKRKRDSSNAAVKKKAKLDVTPSKTGSTLNDCSFGEVDDSDEVLERVSAWIPFGLHKSLLLALARAGFQQPTQIQALALPPAIHGRRPNN